MSTRSVQAAGEARFVGNDRLLFGIIFGVLAFWLFAQTTLNISPVMATDLGIETSLMNIAVSITAAGARVPDGCLQCSPSAAAPPAIAPGPGRPSGRPAFLGRAP